MLTSLASFTLKGFLQMLSGLPVFQGLAFQNRYVVISYLHLTLIGYISLFLIGYLTKIGWCRIDTRFAKTGTIFLLGGFAVTETVITAIGLGVAIPAALFLICGFSFLMFTGIGMLFIAQFNPWSSEMLNLPEEKRFGIVK